MRTKEELKQLAINAIDNRREDIYKIGDSIFEEPELGFKEFKTAAKIKEVLDELKVQYEDKIAITGIKAKLKGKESKYNVGIMGELDSVVSPMHPYADKETGAAHCCGHNAMIAGLIGVLYALKDTDIMEDLAGDVSLLAVPAEEYVELAYRNELIKEGKIEFLGGKQEFIRLGVFDDIDMNLMQHTFSSENEGNDLIKASAAATNNGFIGQEIHFIGKESHAGGAPHKGINALSAANLALAAINAQRDTFKESDYIRVHPIITKGGDLVNTVPANVRVETYVRGSNIEGIQDAAEKVTRSWKAGAMAMGAEVEIKTMPGYLPDKPDENLIDVIYDNEVLIFGKEHVVKDAGHFTGSSDVGDVSSILPTIQASIGGVKGDFHSETYEMVDRDIAYLGAAKVLTLSIIDLLYDDASLAKKVVEEFEPIYTKEEYLETWGKIGEKFK
jgi:amidohydrolase